MFAELEAQQQQYGFDSYGIGLTNLEEVFLRVAAEAKNDGNEPTASEVATSTLGEGDIDARKNTQDRQVDCCSRCASVVVK
eukprot:COSAG02_NODE_64766_length_259_cov_1.287500_1_plen_80_part_01